MNIRTFVEKSTIQFLENEGGGSKAFGTFMKIWFYSMGSLPLVTKHSARDASAFKSELSKC